MQTKKKISARNIRENVCPRASRLQKKASQNLQNAEKKVTELIVSSPRKLRFARIPPKLSKDCVSSNQMNHTCVLAQDDMQDICLGYSANGRTCVDHKEVCDDGNPQCMLETIFSPGFHISKDVGGSMTNSAEFIEFFRNENDQVLHHRVIDGLELDASMSLIVQKAAFSAENKEQNTSSHIRAAGPTTCSSHMDVDSAISPDRSDVKEFCNQKPPSDTNVTTSHLDEGFSGADLSPEVSAIYLAMQHSKLECVDEPSQDCSSNQVYDEQSEEFDYFDPYLFIKNLPDLSSVVPTFRPLLLPKQTRSCPSTTLVLDLDETLVHSTLEPCSDADFTFPVNFNLMKHTVYVRCRPYLKDFMEKVASLFEIIIFTASQSIYAEQLLNVLDPKRRVFRHRVYRDSCVLVDGNYLKDLSVLGRDLAHVIIIDNSPQAFGFQVDNGIPIESWFDDRTDQELLLLLPFLESLVRADDVRPLIARKFNIREKVARANYPCAKL